MKIFPVLGTTRFFTLPPPPPPPHKTVVLKIMSIKKLLTRTKMLALVYIRLKARTGVPGSDFIFQLF